MTPPRFQALARRPLRPLLALAATALTLASTGCAITAPQAWEKGALARPEMTMAGDALGDRFNQHIYTSKENASGGNGVGGGGCGCN